MVRHVVEGSFAVAKTDQLLPLSNRPYGWQVAMANGWPLVLYTVLTYHFEGSKFEIDFRNAKNA